MKKILILMLLISIITTFTGCVINSEHTPIDFGDNTEVAKKVVAFVTNNAQNWIGDVAEIAEIADVYPICFFMYGGSQFIEKYYEGNSLNEMILPDKYWEVITETKQIITVRQENDIFEIYSIRTKGPFNMNNDIIVDKEMVQEGINQLKISRINSIHIVSDIIYPITYVILVIGNIEYVIPFCSRPDFSNLENGKIYTAEEAIQALKEWYCAS